MTFASTLSRKKKKSNVRKYLINIITFTPTSINIKFNYPWNTHPRNECTLRVYLSIDESDILSYTKPYNISYEITDPVKRLRKSDKNFLQ